MYVADAAGRESGDAGLATHRMYLRMYVDRPLLRASIDPHQVLAWGIDNGTHAARIKLTVH